MKIYEVLCFSREILDRLEYLGIRPDDHKYLDLYNDYRDMKARQEKVTYIVVILAVKYGISERKVYNIVHRFGKDCTLCAPTTAPENCCSDEEK